MKFEELSAEKLLERLRDTPKETAIDMLERWTSPRKSISELEHTSSLPLPIALPIITKKPTITSFVFRIIEQGRVSIWDGASGGYTSTHLPTNINIKKRERKCAMKARILKLHGIDRLKVAIAEAICKVFYFADGSVRTEEGSKIRQLIKEAVGSISELNTNKTLFQKIVSKIRDRLHTGCEEFIHQWGKEVYAHLSMDNIDNDMVICMLNRAFGNAVDLNESLLWARRLCYWYIKAFYENGDVERKFRRRNIDKAMSKHIAEAASQSSNLDAKAQAKIKPCATEIPILASFAGHHRKTFAVRARLRANEVLKKKLMVVKKREVETGELI